MKNRKKILVAFLLVAVMIMGVGYAAFSDTLTNIGNVVIDIKQAEANYDEKVYWSAGEFTAHGTGDATKDTVGGVGAGSDDATYNIHSLATKGEKAVVVFTIKNESNVPVKITIPEKKLSGVDNQSNSNAQYFSVEYAYGNTDMIIAANGGTMTVTITVTVIDSITVATGATFGIEFTATTVDATAGA